MHASIMEYVPEWVVMLHAIVLTALKDFIVKQILMNACIILAPVEVIVLTQVKITGIVKTVTKRKINTKNFRLK